MRTLIAIALVVFTSLANADLAAMKARVPTIVELKEKGLIGEQVDGYLGVVKDDGSAKSVVDAENADRKEEYEKRAQTQGQSVETLARVLGEARIRQEKAGRFVKADGAGWVKK